MHVSRGWLRDLPCHRPLLPGPCLCCNFSKETLPESSDGNAAGLHLWFDSSTCFSTFGAYAVLRNLRSILSGRRSKGPHAALKNVSPTCHFGASVLHTHGQPSILFCKLAATYGIDLDLTFAHRMLVSCPLIRLLASGFKLGTC